MLRLSLSSWLVTIVLMGVVALVALSLAGPAYALGMAMDEQGNMAGCLFTGELSVCPMTVLQHLAGWRVLLAATSPRLIAWLAALALVALALTRWRIVIWLVAPVPAACFRLYSRQQVEYPLFNQLRRAFSRGLLHPKVY